MVKIHGAVYVILGILMAAYSRFIQNKVQKPSMSLFFWVGIGFLVYGVFRLLIQYVFSDKSASKKNISSSNPALDRLKREKEMLMNKNNTNNNSTNSNTSQDSSSKEIVACPRCKTKHYSNSNFCHMCGFSLK